VKRLNDLSMLSTYRPPFYLVWLYAILVTVLFLLLLYGR
jgi:hypothetical protein